MSARPDGERVQPRYVERFVCSAGACTATCCVGWRIDVDRESYERMRVLTAAASEEARAEFERNVHLTPEPRADRHRHALILLRDDAACAFLDEDRLCWLQRHVGEDALSDLCALYPRELRVVRGRVEITATLSCPEIARAALLADDANELVRAPDAPTPLNRVRALVADGASPWFDAIDEVCDGFWEILRQADAPLAARLAAIGCAAAETRPWFHRAAPTLDCDRLRAVFARHASAEVLGTLARELATMDGQGDRSAATLMSFLEAVPKSATSPFGALLRSIGAAYAARDGATPFDTVYAAYRRRRRRWMDRDGAAIDRLFTRWAVSYVVRDWYVDERDLVAYVVRLLVRVAGLRFLLLSDPRLDAADDADEATRRKTLEETAVAVVQAYTRDVEHAGGAVVEFDTKMRERMPTIAHALFLLEV
jgi:lysine-N-methylase